MSNGSENRMAQARQSLDTWLRYKRGRGSSIRESALVARTRNRCENYDRQRSSDRGVCKICLQLLIRATVQPPPR
jgi:hypothetical protein